MASQSSTVCYNTLKFLSFDVLDDVSSSSYSPVPSDNSTELSTSPESTELSASPESSGSPDHVSAETLTSVASSSVEVPKHKSSPLKFPPCVICGGKASGLHYGCNTCEACKNFFRRYLVRKKGYICPKQKDCGISYSNKSNCSGCRLAKCLDHGMSKTKSKLGRYSYNKRTETINKMKQLEANTCETLRTESPLSLSSPVSQNLYNSSITKSPLFSMRGEEEFDESFIEMLTKAVDGIQLYEDEELTKEEVKDAKCKEHHERYLLKVNMFGSMNAVSKEEYNVLLKDYGIDLDDMYGSCLKTYEVWKRIIERYCDYSKALPGFSELSKNDQTNLLKSTNFMTFSILMHNCYSSKYNVFVEADGSTYHVEECADKFMSRETTIECAKICEHFQKLKLTIEEVALLVPVCTFSTDCCRLENFDLVEKIQTKYLNLLLLYLKTRYDHVTAVKRLSKFLDCLIRMRGVSNKYHQEINELKKNELFVDALPYLLELTPSEDW